MKAEELRIGNLLKWLDDSNDIITITGVLKGETTEESTIYYDEINPNNPSGEVYLFEFEGIALTSEWLLKLGFKKDELNPPEITECNYNYKEIEIRFVGSGICIFWCPTKHDCMAKGYRYVHQLQNLFFALTGEELKLK